MPMNLSKKTVMWWRWLLIISTIILALNQLSIGLQYIGWAQPFIKIIAALALIGAALLAFGGI